MVFLSYGHKFLNVCLELLLNEWMFPVKPHYFDEICAKLKITISPPERKFSMFFLFFLMLGEYYNSRPNSLRKMSVCINELQQKRSSILK